MLDCPLPLTGGAFRLRAAPPHPVIRAAAYSPDEQLRYTHSRIWGSRPKLLWVTYHPHESDIATGSRLVQRVTRWSYRAGYDGFVIVSLYPLLAPTLAAVKRWRGDPAQAAELAIVTAATMARAAVLEMRCQDAVMATGALNPGEADDLEAWLRMFQGERGPSPIRRWWCIGITERDWPLAPARAGAKAVQDDTPLKRWQFPSRAVAPLRSPAKRGSDGPARA